MGVSRVVKEVVGPISRDKAEKLNSGFVEAIQAWYANQANTPTCRPRRLAAEKVLDEEYKTAGNPEADTNALVLVYDDDEDKFHIARVTSVGSNSVRVSNGKLKMAVKYAAVLPKADTLSMTKMLSKPLQTTVAKLTLEEAISMGRAMAVMDHLNSLLIKGLNSQGRYAGTLVMYGGRPCQPREVSTNPTNVSIYVSGLECKKGDLGVAHYTDKDVWEMVAPKPQQWPTDKLTADQRRSLAKALQLEDGGDDDYLLEQWVKHFGKKRPFPWEDMTPKKTLVPANPKLNGYWPVIVNGPTKTGVSVTYEDGTQVTVPADKLFTKL